MLAVSAICLHTCICIYMYHVCEWDHTGLLYPGRPSPLVSFPYLSSPPSPLLNTITNLISCAPGSLILPPHNNSRHLSFAISYNKSRQNCLAALDKPQRIPGIRGVLSLWRITPCWITGHHSSWVCTCWWYNSMHSLQGVLMDRYSTLRMLMTCQPFFISGTCKVHHPEAVVHRYVTLYRNPPG